MATLKFNKGRIDDLAHTPNEEGLKSVLVMEGQLTYGLAQKLLCDGMLFDGKGRPRPFSGSVGLAKGIKDAEIAIPQNKGDGLTIIQCDVPKLSAKHAENDDDEELRLTIRVHCNSNHHDLLDFVMDKRKAEIKFELRKRQGELFDEEDAEDQAEPAAKSAGA